VSKSAEETGYPKTLEVLVDGVPDTSQPADKQKMIYFLRRLPRDPMAPDTVEKAADTWGKRSYDSPPDDPKEGDDVYDVYSKSDEVGLNNVPYRDW
jgi:general secretion pathway protein G